MTKVIVCGGRKFGTMWSPVFHRWTMNVVEREFLYSTLTELNQIRHFTRLAHGFASGADTLAENWSLMNGVLSKRYPADWHLGKRAGMLRNQQMLTEESPNLVVGFKGSNGTKNMIDIARAAGVEVLTPGWEY